MVHRDERLVPEERERSREVDADPQRRFEPGTCGDGDYIYLWRLALRDEFKKLFFKSRFALQYLRESGARFFGDSLYVFV